jgi:hypothetical protein
MSAAPNPRKATADRRETLLDEALQETFPASDPIAVSAVATGPTRAHATRSARSGRAAAKAQTKRAKRLHYRTGSWNWPKSPNK